MTIPIEDRIKYYIGEVKEPYTRPNFGFAGYDVPIAVNLPTYRSEFQTIHPNTAYPVDIDRIGRHSATPTLWFQCGDSPYTDANWPMLVKIRDTENKTSKGILANLESPRHFGDLFKFADTPWEQKKAEWIWRGADTGRGVRLEFVKKFIKDYIKIIQKNT